MRIGLRAIDRGVVYMVLASLSFAFMGGFAKELSHTIPPLEVTFFRNLFGVVVVLASLGKYPLRQIGGKPWLLLFRGTIGFLALLAYFYDLAHIPLGEAVTYNKTSPIFAAIFAAIFLRERMPRSAWLAVVLGFVGIVLIARPDGVSLDRYDLLGIFSGAGAALAYTSIRELRRYYDTRAIVLSFMGMGTIGPIVLMAVSSRVQAPELDFLFAEFVMPHGRIWLYALGVGFFATISQFLMTRAYELTQAGIVGTASYTNIVFAVIIGVMLGDPFPDGWSSLGIALVIGSGLIVARAKS